jgi:hypothetical protein
MQHPDEGTIHAWIDGELPFDEAAALEAHLNDCAECSALAAEARGLVAASSRIVSALDIVPGGVIPKTALRQRAWYASTQLRAAAAVAIVAGASLLVMRDRGEMKMERAMQSSAPAAVSVPAAVPAQTELDTVTPRAKASIPPVTSPLQVAQKIPDKKKAVAEERSELQKSAANDAVMAAPNAVATPPAEMRAMADEMSAAKQRAQTDSPQRRGFARDANLNQVIVTGVATATVGSAELKKLRTDSSMHSTVYELSPGVEVVVFDQGLRNATALRAPASAQAKETRQAAPQAAPAPVEPAPKAEVLSGKVAGAATTTARINSISWTDKRGHLMVMTGPLSKEELEGLRKRLPPEQR